jgi:hypothetical protein
VSIHIGLSASITLQFLIISWFEFDKYLFGDLPSLAVAGIATEENFLILLTTKSCVDESFLCNVEMNLALKHGKRIIPVVIASDPAAALPFRMPEGIIQRYALFHG